MLESRINLPEIQAAIDDIRHEMGKIIIGQQQFIQLLLAGLLADGHILIEGVPGIAKTLTAKLLAKTISTNFSRIQFTPDLMPSDLLGTSVFNVKIGDFFYKKGPIFSNLVLIDEINRAPAKTQSALFEVMEERQISADTETFHLSPPFMVLATQNPIEQEGTYRLPEAQLDRFLMKIEVGYPNVEEELAILQKFQSETLSQQLAEIRPILSVERLLAARELCRQIHSEETVLHYIAQITDKTRRHKDIYLGASPRASLAMLQLSKAIAAMQGRDFITPDDIKFIAPAVICHRLVLTPESEMAGRTPAQIVQNILQEIPIPR